MESIGQHNMDMVWYHSFMDMGAHGDMATYIDMDMHMHMDITATGMVIDIYRQVITSSVISR